MDTLVVTMDVYYAASDRLYAAKEGHLAVKGVAITAKDRSIVRIVGLLAAKRRVSEEKRVYFAVMRGDHATM
jgi:hypothetical protein